MDEKIYQLQTCIGNVNTLQVKKHTSDVFLDVVAVVSNPVRYKTRYRLYNEFCQRMKANPRVRLLTLEVQHRARKFATDAMVKLRTEHELWHKENMMNLALHYLPHNAEYIAFFDADIEFQRKDFAEEIIEELQHYAVVQPYSHVNLMDSCGRITHTFEGFCYRYVEDGEIHSFARYTQRPHVGFAWAFRKSALCAIGGWFDYNIIGSGDNHLAFALIGQVARSYPKKKLHPHFITLLENYQKRCVEHIKFNIGYVPGIIMHYWHGSRENRKYHERWDILEKNYYDPLFDVKRGCNGLLELENNKHKLRDDIMRYFRERREDDHE